MNEAKCPPEETLRAFAIGAVASYTLEEVVHHLRLCDPCDERLAQYDDHTDELVRALACLNGRLSPPIEFYGKYFAFDCLLSCGVPPRGLDPVGCYQSILKPVIDVADAHDSRR